MGKVRKFEGIRKGSIRIARFIVGNVQASLSLSKGIREEGHFVVVATQSWEPKRFTVELGLLNHPEFLRLLKQAEEQFGFSHEGALSVPCRADELQRILG